MATIGLDSLYYAKITEAPETAAVYDEDEAYAVGDYCTYNGSLYVCKVEITLGEEWTPAHWEAVDPGAESYGTPKKLAKAMNSDININRNQGTLYADDGASEVVDEFKDGTISLGINDIGTDTAVDLLGVTRDANGAVVSTGEDISNYVAIGFRAKKSNGKYRYFWLYRTKFGVPSSSLKTKGDSVEFSTPTLEGTIMRRTKKDANNKHPWKTEITEGDPGVTSATINSWFNAVYEPSYNA